MKKNLILFLTLVATLCGCAQKFELDTAFTMPTELDSPANVTLDVTSTSNVVLSWTGGFANDGGIVLYNVLFDKENGDFSNPVAKMQSDFGSGSQLTLSHAQLNAIARDAGIKPNESGKLIWTVTGAKGGVTKKFEGFNSINVTRGEGIDNMPEFLYINGSAAREAGQTFRVAEKGLYIIYTEVNAGNIYFSSEQDGGFRFFADATGKLAEGEGNYSIETAPESGLARITVNFNTLNVKVEEVGTSVRLAWGATYSDPATDPITLEYAGNGTFEGRGEVVFYGPGREGTPSWCSWVEERYYFIATVNGKEVCWGSNDAGNAMLPDGTDAHFYLNEFTTVSQWDNLWKMDHAMDLNNVAVTIHTNKDNTWTHEYEVAGPIVYEQPTVAPAELYIYGTAAETEGAAFRKEADGVFVIYQQLKDGTINFADAEQTKYFHDADNKLYIGKRNAEVAASEGVTRVTVDFNTNTVTYDQIGAEVKLYLAWTEEVLMTLTYQGNGKFSGEGTVKFHDAGWAEERYSFVATVNGENKVWGRIPDFCDGQSRPDAVDTPANWFYIGEFDCSPDYNAVKWNNLWKFASELENSVATCTIDTNADGAFTHSFVKASVDPVPPTMAPSELALYGTGAEVEGQAFRKVDNGVFEIYAKLKEGAISFKSSNKNYFLDETQGLLEGEGTGASTASGENVTRITVNFQDNTVKFDQINKVRIIWGCNFVDIMTLSYTSAGKWEGEGVVNFVQPGDPTCTWLTWVEQRYYFIPTINGAEEKCWGRKDSVTGNDLYPSDEPDFYDINEFGWSQWEHLWKFAEEMNGATVNIVIDSNKDGVMTHIITKK